MKTHILLLLILLAFRGNLFCQPQSLKFEHLGLDEGLSQTYIKDIIQDKKGFMWIGTRDGLNRYDGYEFTIFKNNTADKTSLSNNEINRLFEDSRGTIWVATINGLNSFDKDHENFTRYTHNLNDSKSISSNYINSIAEDRNGNLWIGCGDDGKGKGGLNLFDRQTKKFRRYAYQENAAEAFTINDIFIDSYENLWIAYKKGILLFDIKTKSFASGFTHHPANSTSLGSNGVRLFFEDSKQNLWIGTHNSGIELFDRKSKTFRHFKNIPNTDNGLPSNAILSIEEDMYGRLWIGMDNGGLSIFNTIDGTFNNYSHDPNNATGLNNNSVYSICRDSKGNMWLGTFSGGINFFNIDQNKFIHYRQNASGNGLNNQTVFSIREDAEGNILIATDGGGLNILNKSSGKFSYLRHEEGITNTISGNHVISVLEDSYQNLWIGTWGAGVTMFNRKKNTYKHFKNNPGDPSSLSGNNVWIIYEDSHKNIWIGTYWEGINLYDRENDRFIHFRKDVNTPDGLKSNGINSFMEDREGNLWIGTVNGGLCRMNRTNNKFTVYLHDETRNSISDNVVTNTLEDAAGNLWIGTSNGLNYFDKKNNKFTVYTTKEGLHHNAVRGMVTDTKGNVWISTHRGISRYDIGTRQIKSYDISNEWEALTHALCKSRNGTIYVGGIDGLIEFHPDSIKDVSFDPPLVFTDFQIFYESVPVADSFHIQSPLKKSITETGDITVSYKESAISFSFASLHYTEHQKKQYAYKLEGFDENWNNIGIRRTATYTNLDPGTYVLKVRGLNNEGNWSDRIATLTLTITPPYWKTWWFRLLSFFILLGLAAAWYTNRINTIKQQKNELEKQVKERTHELSIANIKLTNQTEELAVQAENLTEQGKMLKGLYTELTDSIRAAQDMQNSILPSPEKIKEYLPESFILYKPKDVVSGDFYWFGTKDEKIVIAAVDCTGHGVSGAFMSISGYYLLNQTIYGSDKLVASDTLAKLNDLINQDKKKDQQNGMTVALCILDLKNMHMQYGGAGVPLYIIRDGKLQQIKGDPFSLGLTLKKIKHTDAEVPVKRGDMVYIFSDGYADQINLADEKFSYKRFRELLEKISGETMDNQLKILDQQLIEWAAGKGQLDDILVMGFRIV